MRRPRTIRGRLLLTVMVVATVITVVATVAFSFILAHALSDDADDVARLRAASEITKVRVRDGRVVVLHHAGAVDARVWVLHGGTFVSAPDVSAAVTARVLPFVRSGTDFIDVPGQSLRLHALPVKDHSGRRVGTVVVGISLASFQGTQRTSVTIWLVSAVLLLLGIFLAARWLIDSTLRPVARMTADAEAWSTSDTLERFSKGDPRDELDRLAVTLDRLLDRLSASLRREQLLSLELSHELRTPLARLCAEAEVALRHSREPSAYRLTLERVLADGRQMSGIVDTLMLAAQAEATPRRGSADPGEVLSDVIDACADEAAARGITFAADGLPGGVRLGVDAAFATRVLQPIADNACRYAASTVRLAVACQGRHVAIRVSDDGPGLEPGEEESVFSPGVRGGAGSQADAPAGAGLGLALARRLARAVSGDVVAERTASGACFVVLLPLAPET